MRRFRTFVLVLVATQLMACATAPGNEFGPLQRAGSTWAKYYKAGDLDGLMSLYMDDAIVALHGQPALFGIAQIRDYFSKSIGKADVEFILDYELLELHKETAHLMSKYWLTAVDKRSGETYRDAGRSVLIYKRGADGDWKIALDIDQATPDVTWPAPARASP